HGVKRLIDEFGLTHEQAAQAIGRSRSATTNLLRLINLAEPVQVMLLAGDIDMGHARALLATDAATQIMLANEVIARRLSVRETEKLVNSPYVMRKRQVKRQQLSLKQRMVMCFVWKKCCPSISVHKLC